MKLFNSSLSVIATFCTVSLFSSAFASDDEKDSPEIEQALLGTTYRAIRTTQDNEYYAMLFEDFVAKNEKRIQIKAELDRARGDLQTTQGHLALFPDNPNLKALCSQQLDTFTSIKTHYENFYINLIKEFNDLCKNENISHPSSNLTTKNDKEIERASTPVLDCPTISSETDQDAEETHRHQQQVHTAWRMPEIPGLSPEHSAHIQMRILEAPVEDPDDLFQLIRHHLFENLLERGLGKYIVQHVDDLTTQILAGKSPATIHHFLRLAELSRSKLAIYNETATYKISPLPIDNLKRLLNAIAVFPDAEQGEIFRQAGSLFEKTNGIESMDLINILSSLSKIPSTEERDRIVTYTHRLCERGLVFNKKIIQFDGPDMALDILRDVSIEELSDLADCASFLGRTYPGCLSTRVLKALIPLSFPGRQALVHYTAPLMAFEGMHQEDPQKMGYERESLLFALASLPTEHLNGLWEQVSALRGRAHLLSPTPLFQNSDDYGHLVGALGRIPLPEGFVEKIGVTNTVT